MTQRIHLRDLLVGTRFELLRTGEKFKLVEKRIEYSRTRWICHNQVTGKVSTLSNQCAVNPIIKPRIKLKGVSK